MIYFAIISAVAVLFTVYDKIAAKHLRRTRVPEAMLLAISAAGGSVAMLLTMVMIAHKTRRFKFMIGIPVIIILQVCGYMILKRLGI